MSELLPSISSGYVVHQLRYNNTMPLRCANGAICPASSDGAHLHTQRSTLSTRGSIIIETCFVHSMQLWTSEG